MTATDRRVIAVDTSAIVAVIASRAPSRALSQRIRQADEMHVPHLIDVEVLHVLRRLVIAKELSLDRATDARTDFVDFPLVRYPHEVLTDRAWELGNNLTAYDAMFVALAEALDIPLVTCDAKLAASPGHDADIELYPAAER